MDWTQIGKSAQRLLSNQQGLSVEFTLNGRTLWGVRTTLRREVVNTDAGLDGVYNYSLLCPYSIFGVKLPEPRVDKVKIDGVEMRILSIDIDSAKATVRLNLGDITA